MKTLQTCAVLALLCLSCSLTAQKKTETSSKELSVSGSISEHHLVVQNINGSIEVEGYNGNTILIETEKTITGKNSEELQRGLSEINLKTAQKTDYSYVYLDSPYTTFDLEKGLYNHNQWNGSHFEERNYKYQLTMKIKVPSAMNVRVQTVNNGDILIKDVHPDQIEARNINGAITLDNISGQTYANALNQDINVHYKTAPNGESTFNSLNGDINVTVRSTLNATVSFKSLNGDFYTNLETVSMTPSTAKEELSDKKGTKYKVTSNEQFQIGNGGVALHFDVLNGDVTVKNK